MKIIAFALSLAGLLVAAYAPQTFTGVVTDTMCGARHEMMRGSPDHPYLKMCVKPSGDYALYDGKEVWKLSDQKKAAQFPAKKMTVTRTANASAKTIKVVSIEAAG